MISNQAEIPGGVVDLDRIEDGRGIIARSFCAEEFADRGLCKSVVQANFSFNLSWTASRVCSAGCLARLNEAE